MIETERLLLRPVRADDIGEFASIFGDPEVMRYVGAGKPLEPGDVAQLIQRNIRLFEADGFGQFAVERRADRRVLGRVGLIALDPETWTFGSLAEVGGHAEIEIG